MYDRGLSLSLSPATPYSRHEAKTRVSIDKGRLGSKSLLFVLPDDLTLGKQ